MHPLVCLSVTALLASAAVGQTAQYNAPTFDRWNYPFNLDNGGQETFSTFSPGFTPGNFDDRDAQVLVSYATGGDFAPGLGPQNYIVTSATVTATIASGDAFAYDPTYDSFRSSLLPSDPQFAADTDAGLPIELYGTGFSPGLNPFAYGEDFAWGAGGPLDEDVRFAFAADLENAALRNVSNNVRDRFETNPFAIGQTSLNPGDLVPQGAEFSFDLDTSDPGIAGYLAQGLNSGIVSFSLSSLHVAGQQGPIEFPDFWSKEATDAGAVPIQLELTVQIVPTPATAGLMLVGGLVATRRRR